MMHGNVEASRETGGWQLEGRGPEAYEEYLVPKFFRPWAERLLSVSGVAEGERVLDVGCGTGIVARSAAPLVGDKGHVAGVDLNRAMLETARRAGAHLSPAVEWRKEDATELSFQDDSFDVALSQQVLQFVSDPLELLVQLRRVLRPGGRVGLNVLRPIRHNPSYELLAEVLERHAGEEAGAMIRSPFPEWSGARLQELLIEAGFDRVSLLLDIRAVRYPSAEEYLRQEAASSPLADSIAGMEETVRTKMVGHLEEVLEDYTDRDGVVFPMETHLVVAG
jgi:ubiquinone/menaquinone biosynthesis C-methylase UbiE